MVNKIQKNTEDYNDLVSQAMKISSIKHMKPAIEKELLHYDLLFLLDDKGLLDNLTFQGGTALRLCYGGARLSEDLDFVSGKNFSNKQLKDMKDCIEHYIGSRYQLDVFVKEPKELLKEKNHEDVKVDQWQISIVTSPARKDLPMQKIKIQICNVPAYTRIPRALNINYDFLPDGYRDVLILTESLEELFADKLISLVNTTRYVRHRDIWDLRWIKQSNIDINAEFIHTKIKDYKIQDYPEKLNLMIDKIEEIIHGKEFHHEMSRFIPLDVQERTLQKDKFKDHLTIEIKNLLLDVKKIIT